MRDPSRENHDNIGRPDLIFEVCRTLGEHLAFIPELFTDFFVTAVHSVVTADDYNAHNISSLCGIIWFDRVRYGRGLLKNFIIFFFSSVTAAQTETQMTIAKISLKNISISVAPSLSAAAFCAHRAVLAVTAAGGLSLLFVFYHGPCRETYNRYYYYQNDCCSHRKSSLSLFCFYCEIILP